MWDRVVRSAGVLMLVGGCVVVPSSTAFAANAPKAPFNWTQLAPPNSPPVSAAVASDFDAATKQMVIFGGDNNTGNDVSETWVWHAGTWTHLTPAHSPSGRHEAVMAYDPSSNQLLLFGGVSFAGGHVRVFGDTWSWTGSDWTELFPAHQPSARYDSTLAFDSATSQLVLVGGVGKRAYPTDTWAWNGTDWSRLAPVHTPPSRVQATMTSGGTTNGLVLFGGIVGGTAIADTWTCQRDGLDRTAPAELTPRAARRGRRVQPGDWSTRALRRHRPRLVVPLRHLDVDGQQLVPADTGDLTVGSRLRGDGVQHQDPSGHALRWRG
jgi:hypothetical protein